MSADKTQTGHPTRLEDHEYPHRELTQKIMGAAYEVHRGLGSGFLEKVYETALLRELEHRGVGAISQAEIEVHCKGQSVGVYYADILMDNSVICGIKAVHAISPEHEAQLLHYLKATGVKVGLLLNFGSRRLQVKRMVF